jgi:hypothetical protein
MHTYEYTRGLDYDSIVATSERVAWTVDEIYQDRLFDASKRIVPESWVQTRDLDFLNEQEQLTLNHIRAFSYVHMFSNFEEFIPLHLMGLAQRDWHDSRGHLRALMRFGDEEMKHQQLFIRAEAVMEESCGCTFGRYFDAEKTRVTALTKAFLEFPPLPRFLLLSAFEWGSQRHYVDSIQDQTGDGTDDLYADILKAHWIEESQHTKTGGLEIEQLARDMSPEDLSAAFEEVQGVAALADEVFVGQVEQEIETFQKLAGRTLLDAEAKALYEVLYRSTGEIWVDVGMTHPSFTKMVRELSKDGAAKLGIN